MKRIGLGAVILAAGRSSRMGRDKALLTFAGTTALDRLVRTCRDAGVEAPVVVVGAKAPAIRAEAERLHVRMAINSDVDSGPLGSAKAGLLEVAGDPAGILICPVDHPLISAFSLRALAAALAGSLNAPREARAMVFLPVHAGRRGHPVCVSRHLVPEILALSRSATLRDATLRDPARIADVPVEDPWVIDDLDRPEDYQRALQAMPQA